ncbi:MAG: Hsp20/alpha crystallin family protein [Deltaproteobacteria bacterium]|nr:Hsp20/alpha crystallin family protein [Deltaproteobacteria bacterium]
MNRGIDKTIAEMFKSMHPIFSFSKTAWKPQIDVFETAKKIFIRADVAGVEKAEIGLEISPDAVRISGRRSSHPPAENGRYRLVEIEYGPFERVVRLPYSIDTETVVATYKRGFLIIEMEKLPPVSRQNTPIREE